MNKALKYTVRAIQAVALLLIGIAAWIEPALASTAAPLFAVTSADLTTLAEALKRVYDPVIAEQQNLVANTYREFEEQADVTPMPGGEGVYFETAMGGNQEGIGARNERGALPAAGRQRKKQGVFKWFYTYGTFEITGPAIEAAKTSAQAFVNAKMDEIKSLTKDVLKDYNRQVWGKGDGVLATVTADGPVANSFYVDDPLYLRINMMIDVWNGNTNAIDSRQITDILVDGTGWYVVYDGADVAASNGWLVIREDSADLVGGVRTPREIEGLRKIVDDGVVATTYAGISRTTYKLWNGHVLDSAGTGRNITTDLLLQLDDAVVRACGEKPDWIRTNQGQIRKYFDICAPDRRYVGMDFDAGYERLAFQGRKIVIDLDCPKKMWFAGMKRDIRKLTLRQLGVLDHDGRTLRQAGNADVWRGHIGAYWNITSKFPNHHGFITDLNEPVQTDWVW